MAWAYRLLTYCLVVPLLAYLWWRGRKDPAYRLRWRERFGRQDLSAHWRGGVVLHCASVGEVIAARPLVELLLADARYQPLVLTCSTPTGSRMIRQHYGDRAGHLYFPFDLPGAARSFLRRLRPRLVLLLERELWPTFLHQAQTEGVPVALVNARLSAVSAAGYARWRGAMGPAIASLRLVCTQDAETAARLTALGVAAQRMAITGNIKSDVQVAAALRHRIESTRALLAGRSILTAGSTHAGEDEALIDAFKEHLAGFPQALLVLVPRHPERFDVVASLLTRSGLRFVRHGLGHMPQPDTQVILGDTMGELLLWYGVADACFVGGSLIARGGHNPLEVLCLHKPLIAGPHTANFEQCYSALLAAGGMLPAADAHAVLRQFCRVLRDDAIAKALVAGGDAVYQGLAGASARTMARLEGLIHPSQRHDPVEPSVLRNGCDLIWFDPACFDTASPDMFDPAWWQLRGSASRRSGGRGQVHVVTDGQRSYLLRHYQRGGLMARLSRDLFLAQSIRQTRAMRELLLLARLRARDLPVPRACAARHTRVGLCYRADILLENIAQARDVADLLHTQRALTAREWRLLGRAVRQLHEEQVCHADLNCHNLMLDAQGKAWIVDFDKCGFRAGEKWKRQNLDRLLRSLRKELRLDPGFRWSERDWSHLLAGYGLEPATQTA